MKNKPLLYSTFGGLILLVAVAAYFATSENAPQLTSSEAPVAQTQAGKPNLDPNQNTNTPWVRKSREEVAAMYSSNPPKPQYIKEAHALARRLDMTDLEKAKALLNQIPNLPEDGQLVAMSEATGLIPDENYVALRPWLYQLAVSEELKEIVVTDVMNRGDDIRFPTMVDFLKQPKNGQTEEVRQTLIAFLDKDYGTDAAKWDVAVKQFLTQIQNEE